MVVVTDNGKYLVTHGESHPDSFNIFEDNMCTVGIRHLLLTLT